MSIKLEPLWTVWKSNAHTWKKRKKEITQCDTHACSRSNNVETNSFFALSLNSIKSQDWYRRRKKISCPSGGHPAKVFQLSALRSEKTEYGKNEGRAANARLRSFQFNEWILINSPFNPDLRDTFPISWIQINVYRSVRTCIPRNRNPFQFNLFERNKYVNSDSCNKPAILWWKIYKLSNHQWRETKRIIN